MTVEMEESGKNPFNIEEFLSSLKTDNAIDSVKDFISRAQDPNDDDVVKDFVVKATKNDHSALLSLINRDKTTSEVTILFEMLHEIFIRIAVDLKDFSPWALPMIRQLLQADVMKQTQRGLSIKNTSREIIQTLKYLTSMVVASPQAAKEVYTQFKFNGENFYKVLNRVTFKLVKDVRAYAIDFVLSFLMSGNLSIKRQLLENKDLFKELFKGLPADKYSTIEVFLSGILSQVVEDKTITKTLKIGILDHETLGHVMKLLLWKGPKVSKKKFEKKSEKLSAAEIEAGGEVCKVASTTEIKSVHRLTQEFLIAVCTSHRLGIIFKDPAMGTARNANFNIYLLLKNAGMTPFSRKRIAATFSEILKACPDQIHLFFSNTSDSFEPRESSVWFGAMSFLNTVLGSVDLMNIIDVADMNCSVTTIAQMFMNVSTIATFTKKRLQDILLNENKFIRHQGVCYMAVVFIHLRKLCDETQKEAQHLKNKIINYMDFKKRFFMRVFRHLPQVNVVVSCWNMVCNSKVDNDQLDETDVNSFSVYEHLKILLSCLGSFLEFDRDSSEIFTCSSLVGLLFSLCNVEKQMKENELIEIQLDILQQMGKHSSNSKLLLEKINNKSVTRTLLDILLQTGNSATKRITLNLIKQLLISTDAFPFTSEELDIWLKHLMLYSDPSVATECFQIICETLASNSSKYIQNNTASKEIDDTTSMTEEEEQLNKLFDEILEDDVNDDDVFYEDIKIVGDSSFSPLIHVALNILEDDKLSSDQRYKFGIFCCLAFRPIFQTRPNPTPLLNLFKKHFHLLTRDFQEYLYNHEGIQCITKSSKKAAKKPNVEGNFSLQDFIELLTTETSWISDVNSDSMQKALNNFDTVRYFLLFNEILTCLHFHDTSKGMNNEVCGGYCSLLLYMMNRDLSKEDEDLPFFRQNLAEQILRRPVIQNNFLKEKEYLTNLALAALKSCPNLSSTTKRLYQKKTEEFLLENVEKFLRIEISVSELVEPFIEDFSTDYVSELITKLSELPTDLLVDSEDRSLNVTGVLLVKLIHRGARLVSARNTSVVSGRVFSRLFSIVTELGIECLAESLIAFLESDLIHCLAVDEVAFGKLLEIECFTPVFVKLMEILCSSSLDLLNHLERHLLTADRLDRECLPLIFVYLRSYDSSKWETENSIAVLKKLKKRLWRKALNFVCSEDTTEEDLELTNLLTLLKHFSKFTSVLRDKDLVEFCGRFSTSSLKSDAKIEILKSSKWIFDRLAAADQLLDNYNPLAVYIFNWIQSILESLKKLEKEEVKSRTIENVTYFTEVIANINEIPTFGRIIHQKNVWHQLIKKSLKFGLKDESGSSILKMLTTILKKLKPKEELRSMHCTSICQLLVGHSNFIPGLLQTSHQHLPWKNCLLDLLTFLVESEKSCCDPALVPILLSAYSASLGNFDQKLLYLIYLYEESGIDVHSYRPFLWGPTAVDHYSVNKSLTHSLWKQPKMEEVLNLLDPEMVLETSFKFPLSLQLQPQVHEMGAETSTLYDPRFLHSLLNNLLSPECLVNCMKVIESNCLCLLFASLSSEDDAMRSAAYQNLTYFYQHLEGARFKLNNQWLLMLDCLKNAIVIENQRLAPLISVFLIRCCQLLLNPSDLMSKPIINFLLLKPKLDIQNVPEFITLFHSGDVKNHELHRSWMLTYLNLGFRSTLDYNLCGKRHVFKLVMAYFDSPLASFNGKLLVLEFVKQATSVARVTEKLIKRHGLFPFLGSALLQKKDVIVSLCIQIISNIYYSTERVANTTTVSQVLSLLLQSLSSLRECQSLKILEGYLKTLTACLKSYEADENLIHTKGLKSQHLEKLINIYKSSVHENASNNKGDATDGTNKKDLSESCTRCMCDIVTKWRCDGNEQLFNEIFELLLKSVKVGVKNSDKLQQSYEFFMRIFVQMASTAQKDIGMFQHLFHSFNYLLFSSTSNEQKDERTRNLQATFSLFVLMVKNLNVADYQHRSSFTRYLALERVKRSLDSLALAHPDLPDTFDASFALGVFAGDLWLQNEETGKFQYYTKNFDSCQNKRKLTEEETESPKKKPKKKST